MFPSCPELLGCCSPGNSVRRFDVVDEAPVADQGGGYRGRVLAGTVLEAAGRARGTRLASSATRRRRMIQMLKTWPDSGIPISLEALPVEVRSSLFGAGFP